MNKSDDYIIISESHEAGEEPTNSVLEERVEETDSSFRDLEIHGISILSNEEITVSDKPRDQFTRELMDEGGIEIVSNEEEESFL